ncbi:MULTISPECIES: hypothetical protein [unclassified Mesorhizobium]|uniref:hypothetical protein n=1 Tax=unclassified Mesorhizobium TaxID=325217 RepID=UPI003014DEE7
MPEITNRPYPDYRMMEIEKTVGELPAMIAALFAPREWPRSEMLALLHSMATDAGIPEKCEDAACRRSGICRAGTLGEQGPPCGAHWPDALVQRFEGACEGMALSWILEERRANRARNALLPPQPAQPRARKKRPVSTAR